MATVTAPIGLSGLLLGDVGSDGAAATVTGSAPTRIGVEALATGSFAVAVAGVGHRTACGPRTVRACALHSGRCHPGAESMTGMPATSGGFGGVHVDGRALTGC
jgi:hypothetical protein